MPLAMPAIMPSPRDFGIERPLTDPDEIDASDWYQLGDYIVVDTTHKHVLMKLLEKKTAQGFEQVFGSFQVQTYKPGLFKKPVTRYRMLLRKPPKTD